MKIYSLACLTLLLVGCGKDLTDLQEYANQVKATAQTNIEPMPTVEKYESFEYSVTGLRSPFVAPKPELIQDKYSQSLDCLQPSFRRNKEPLEKYPLDNVKMRGTLGSRTSMFALVSASDGSLYRVSVGNHIGLFHGKIVDITSEAILLEEMIPDGTGCWEIRKAEITILGTDADSGNNNNDK